MGATITHSTGVISPTSMTQWSASTPARTIIHEILDRSDDDVSFRPAGLRRGTLTLVFETGSDAYAARAILMRPEPFTLAHDRVPEVGMTFVFAEGDMGDVLGRASEWTLTVPFREVLP